MTGLPKAKGTQGQLAGKQVGTAKGQGKAKGKVSGASPKDAPETDAKTLKDLGIDENLAAGFGTRLIGRTRLETLNGCNLFELLALDELRRRFT